MTRIIYSLAFVVFIPFVPWWFLVLLAVSGIIFFHQYFESIVLFFFYDLLFGLPSGRLGTQFSFTIIILLVFLLVESYKDRLRFYN